MKSNHLRAPTIVQKLENEPTTITKSDLHKNQLPATTTANNKSPSE